MTKIKKLIYTIIKINTATLLTRQLPPGRYRTLTLGKWNSPVTDGEKQITASGWWRDVLNHSVHQITLPEKHTVVFCLNTLF